MQLDLKKHKEQIWAYSIIVAAIGVYWFLVRPPFFGEGFVATWDAHGHLFKAHYWAHDILRKGALDGWFPFWHGGFALIHVYPPLLTYLLGILTLLAKPIFILRVVMFLLIVGLVPVMYNFLRSFNVNRIPAAVGSTFMLTLNADFATGLSSLYMMGLIANGLGFLIAIFLMSRLKRDLSQPQRQNRSIVITSITFSLLVLSHAFSAYWWGVMSVVLVLSEIIPDSKRSLQILGRYFFIIFMGLLISCFWWIPFGINFETMKKIEEIAFVSRPDILLKLLKLKEGSGPLGWAFGLMALVGIYHLWSQKKWSTFIFLVGTALFTLLLATNTINSFLPFATTISIQRIRFEGIFWNPE